MRYFEHLIFSAVTLQLTKMRERDDKSRSFSIMMLNISLCPSCTTRSSGLVGPSKPLILDRMQFAHSPYRIRSHHQVALLANSALFLICTIQITSALQNSIKVSRISNIRAHKPKEFRALTTKPIKECRYSRRSQGKVGYEVNSCPPGVREHILA